MKKQRVAEVGFQFFLRRDWHQLLKEEANKQGISFSALIRNILEPHIKENNMPLNQL